MTVHIHRATQPPICWDWQAPLEIIQASSLHKAGSLRATHSGSLSVVRCLYTWVKYPYFLQPEQPHLSHLFLYKTCFCSLSSLWTFAELASACPCLSCAGEHRTGLSILDVHHQGWTEGTDHLPRSAGNVSPNAALGSLPSLRQGYIVGSCKKGPPGHFLSSCFPASWPSVDTDN